MQSRLGEIPNTVNWTATLKIEKITFTDLPAVNTLTSGSDPYCIISLRKKDTQQLEKVVKTEYIKGVVSGQWEVNTTCTLDKAIDAISFEVWDWNKIAKDEAIGVVTLDTRDLLLGANWNTIYLPRAKDAIMTPKLVIAGQLQCEELEKMAVEKKNKAEEEEKAKKAAEEEKSRRLEEALSKFDSQLAQLVENPSEEVYIDAFDSKTSIPETQLVNCVVKFLDQIKPKLTDDNVGNKTIMNGFLVALRQKKTNMSAILALPSGMQLLKKMLESEYRNVISGDVYDYLNNVMNAKFKITSTQFADVFDMYFGSRMPSVKKLARIMWTQTNREQIKKDLELKGNSCPILEKCVDEIMKSEPYRGDELPLALHCFMETMMWCCTFHEINESTMEYISSNVLSSIWSQAPRLILRTKDPNNRRLCDLMKARGGNFADVLRLTSTRYFSIDADTCYGLNLIFRKTPAGYSDQVTGMYKSYNVNDDFKPR